MLFTYSDWIWSGATDEINVYRRFSDSFTAETAGNYSLRLSCDTNYALYINGSFVDCGQYADYEDLKYYDELEVTTFVHEGKNELTIDVYYQGASSSTYRHGSAGLIFELLHNGNLVIASGEMTRVAKLSAYSEGNAVEMITGQLGFSFRYDSRLENSEECGAKAVTVTKTRELLPRPVKKLITSPPAPAFLTVRGGFKECGGTTTGQRMQYAAIAFSDPNARTQLSHDSGVEVVCQDESLDGAFAIIDLGEELAGLFQLDIELPFDCEVLIGWGEHQEDMRVRTSVGGRNFCASYYGREGRNVFFNPFRRFGLRYLELHVYAPSFKLHYAGIRPTDYPVSHRTPFRCADNLHNRIYDVSLRTLLLCMHEHYEDCPWREQALYSMDSRNQMLCGYYAFHEADFARASLRLMAHSLRTDNLLELCSPAEVGITIPSFSAIFLTQLYEFMQFSDDVDFIREMLPCAERIAGEFIGRTRNNAHLIPCFTEEKYWNFYEWQSGLEGSITGSVSPEDVTLDAPLNAFVSFGLRSLADIFKRLGDAGRERYYRNEQLALNRAIDNEFFDETQGAYATYSQNGIRRHFAELTNSLIVYADAASGDRCDSVLRKLAGNTLIPVTLSHSIFKYEALLRQPETYARFVFSDIAAKWGYMLEHGATSFWETIKGASDFGNAGSLCHGWSAIPAYFYLKYATALPPALTGLYECTVKD